MSEAIAIFIFMLYGLFGVVALFSIYSVLYDIKCSINQTHHNMVDIYRLYIKFIEHKEKKDEH